MGGETETEIGPEEWRELEVTCERCQLEIPFEEKELYLDTGLCSWCAHMTAKNRD